MRVSRITSLYIIVTPKIVTGNSQRMCKSCLTDFFRFKVFTIVKKMCARRNLSFFLLLSKMIQRIVQCNRSICSNNTEVDSKTNEALAALDSLYDTIKEQILRNDTNFNKSVIKFEDRYKKMNVSQNSYSLSCYRKTYLDSLRGKIKVQPTAVSRRKFKNGSRQKQDTS